MASKRYTNEDVIRIAAEVKTISSLLRNLGLKPAGGNSANMKRKLQQLNVDTSHWESPGWNKDAQLKDWSKYTQSTRIRVHLLKLRGNICECCGRSEWLNFPIKLELHHVDGDRTNNTLSNLQLLCPNCHSYTDTWRKPNNARVM